MKKLLIGLFSLAASDVHANESTAAAAEMAAILADPQTIEFIESNTSDTEGCSYVFQGLKLSDEQFKRKGETIYQLLFDRVVLSRYSVKRFNCFATVVVSEVQNKEKSIIEISKLNCPLSN